MRQKAALSTAAVPLGLPGGHKLFRVESGQYAGRQVILYQAAPGEIAYVYADRPYASWSFPVTVITDAAEASFDAAMLTSGTIHIAYTDAASHHLVTRRLDFSGGVWSVAPKVTITDRPVAQDPSLAVLPDSTLYVLWTHVDLGVHTLYEKSSGNNGATWGTGPSDPGAALTSGASSAYGRLAVGPTTLWAVYTNGSIQLSTRTIPLSGGAWGSEYHIATGSGFDQHFDVAAASDGRIGVAWDNGLLRYREFDGDQWTPSVQLDASGGDWPQVIMFGSTPLVVYTSLLGNGQMLPKYTVRQGGTFTAPSPLDGRTKTFDSVMLYHAASASYAALTAEAADTATGNVVHPISGVLIQHVGDALFFGMDHPFRFARILLSLAGAGGTVVYSYWSGSAWIAFTPSGGPFHFSGIDHDLLLWDDYNSIPADWQKSPIGGASRFWIKIEVLTEFSNAPVGSQITAVSDILALCLRR